MVGYAVAFSSDGFYGLGAGHENVVRVFELSLGHQQPGVKPKVDLRAAPEDKQKKELTKEDLDEDRASSRLRLARLHVKSNELSAAREKLNEILTKYPKTKAAEEAKVLLEKLEK